MNTTDSITEVVAAVVSRDGSYLIARRPLHKHLGGFWEFPGGKIHESEAPTDAISRELREELGVNFVNTGKTIAVLSDGTIQIRFLIVEIEDQPVALEHSELRWCNLDELLSLDLAPIDERFVVDVLESHNHEEKQ